MTIYSKVTRNGQITLPSKVREELGIEEYFWWRPCIPWEEMPLYYSCSDAMISLSSNDSLPNCMLEAMACRVPVVMGDIPQIREWIPEEFSRFRVSPLDRVGLSEKILWVLENSDPEIQRFVDRNQNLVAREVDSQKNSERIKRLVCQFVGTKSLRGNSRGAAA